MHATNHDTQRPAQKHAPSLPRLRNMCPGSGSTATVRYNNQVVNGAHYESLIVGTYIDTVVVTVTVTVVDTVVDTELLTQR